MIADENEMLESTSCIDDDLMYEQRLGEWTISEVAFIVLNP